MRFPVAIPLGARLGIMLAVIWVLCMWGSPDISPYGSPSGIAERFAYFWMNVGIVLNPSRDPNDWPVWAIALTTLFFLPIFIGWAIKPITSKLRAHR